MMIFHGESEIFCCVIVRFHGESDISPSVLFRFRHKVSLTKYKLNIDWSYWYYDYRINKYIKDINKLFWNVQEVSGLDRLFPP